MQSVQGTPERKPTADELEQSLATLPDGLLFGAIGGLLDAVTYLLHGHVFANAQTGNVVLLATNALSAEWMQAARHLVSLAAFAVGIVSSKLLRLLPAPVMYRVVLGILFVSLAVMGAMPPSLSPMLFTAVIAWAASIQVATFRRVAGFGYNSTFVTGNLRDTFEAISDLWLKHGDPSARSEAWQHALDVGVVCLCFFAGAAVGTVCAPRIGDRTIWLALPALLAIFLLRRRRLRALQAGGSA